MHRRPDDVTVLGQAPRVGAREGARVDGLSPADVGALLAGGLFAGIVNTLAGGGSLLTVPLLVLLGLPGTVANGTNRIGVLL